MANDEMNELSTKLILDRIDGIHKSVEKMDAKFDCFSLSMAERITRLETEMKTKGGLWGAIGGILAASLPLLYIWWRGCTK